MEKAITLNGRKNNNTQCIVMGVNSYFCSLVHWFSPEPPEAPDKPQIDDVTAHSMLVTWNQPNDNGSPILGYWVERREINSSHWARVNR